MSYVQDVTAMEPELTEMLGDDRDKWIQVLLLRDDEIAEFDAWWQLRECTCPYPADSKYCPVHYSGS